MPQDFGSSISSIGGMVPGPAGGIAQAAGGLISGITGFFQRREAKRLLGKLQYPQYEIPKEIFQNQAQAQVNANNGLPSAQYQQAMQNIQRQQGAALRSSGDRRGGLGLVAGIQGNSNNALLGLDVANSKARLQNQNTLYGINSQVAGYRDKQWKNNIKDKYDRDYSYAQGLLAAGNQNLTGGADKLASGLTSGFIQ